ncbi:MAG: flagellar motor protein [Gammaproteobacteria bacterium]|nr:flagellar motor protein [Gammaproteobacteria bacterium]MDH5777385.1 flagellar motor protein [Gammaproteobacteria bacterium]
MDILTLLGLVVGISAILYGQYLDGGHLSTLINGPAGLIVMGGTIGAVMVQTPLQVFLRALVLSRWVLLPPTFNINDSIETIIAWSKIARRDGLLGLDNIDDENMDDFTQKGLRLLVDGNETSRIREVLELEINSRERIELASARVFESMGGYSPTIGIIGAVLGLIQVMGNLTEPDKLGDGIAVAFVATIYGVGAANLIFLPIANKLKTYIHQHAHHHELIMEGLSSIAEGEHPRVIESKLLSYAY